MVLVCTMLTERAFRPAHSRSTLLIQRGHGDMQCQGLAAAHLQRPASGQAKH